MAFRALSQLVICLYTELQRGLYILVFCYIQYMRIYISSDTSITVLEDLWSYCQQHDIPMYHGRILAELGYFGWCVECDLDARISFFLLKYSDRISYIVRD